MERMHVPQIRTLVAAARGTLKPINQDACSIVDIPEAQLWAVIVADGIGSDEGSETVSEEVVNYLAAELKCNAPQLAAKKLGIEHMEALYKSTRSQLAHVRDEAHMRGGHEAALLKSGGSTAVCVIEQQDQFLLAYCGNGAIFHIRADFNVFPSHAVLPWSTVDMLNPHSEYVAGKNVLYRYLYANATEAQARPTVITLNKDLEGPGDIFVICTDGVSSRDQYLVGKNDMGIWTKTDATIPLLYQYLNSFFKSGRATSECLHRLLVAFLGELASTGAMEDDCAIGVLVSSQASAFQAGQNASLKTGEGR